MRFDLNDSIEEDLWRLSGSEFHRRGAAIENAWSPHDRDNFGSKRRALFAERSPELEGAYHQPHHIVTYSPRLPVYYTSLCDVADDMK